MCTIDYYFLKEGRTKCYTNFDLNDYYTEDNGFSYYPCDSDYFPKCKINNTLDCESFIQNDLRQTLYHSFEKFPTLYFLNKKIN